MEYNPSYKRKLIRDEYPYYNVYPSNPNDEYYLAKGMNEIGGWEYIGTMENGNLESYDRFGNRDRDMQDDDRFRKGDLTQYDELGNKYSTFSGQWSNGAKNGQGYYIKFRENEDVEYEYDGNWKDDNFDGYGIFTSITGPLESSYSGNWRNGLKHGEGEARYSNGVKIIKYRGEWKDDKKDGQGEYREYMARSNKILSEYIGYFYDDKFHGQGRRVVYNNNGGVSNIESGRWYNGVLLDTELEDDERIITDYKTCKLPHNLEFDDWSELNVDPLEIVKEKSNTPYCFTLKELVTDNYTPRMKEHPYTRKSWNDVQADGTDKRLIDIAIKRKKFLDSRNDINFR